MDTGTARRCLENRIPVTLTPGLSEGTIKRLYAPEVGLVLADYVITKAKDKRAVGKVLTSSISRLSVSLGVDE